MGELVVIGGQKFSRRGEAMKTLLGYIVTSLWNGVNRRVSKSLLAIRGEVDMVSDF